MKIHAYILEEEEGCDFSATLTELNRRPIEDRFFAEKINIRLEAISRRDRLLLVDFVKRRGNGPGHLRANAPISGFNVDILGGDGFGEETAMVYDPETKIAVIQYNHYGPRALAIVDYLDYADGKILHQNNNGKIFDFATVLQRDAIGKLRQMNQYRSFEARINIPAVDAEDRLEGRALGAVLRAPMGGVETITIRYATSPSRDSSLTPDGVLGAIDQLWRLGGDALQGLKVKGKRPGERVEEVDLIEERLVANHPLEVGVDGRLPRERRWEILVDQYRAWRRDGFL